VPGLGELPYAGRIFSHTIDNHARTEIVLLITPRLARTLARPDASSVEFAAGTEASTGTPRLGAAAPIIPSTPTIPQPPITGGAAPTESTGGTPGEGEPSSVQPAKPAAPPALVPFGGVKPAPQ
jgi:general secretion pathway protein D